MTQHAGGTDVCVGGGGGGGVIFTHVAMHSGRHSVLVWLCIVVDPDLPALYDIEPEEVGHTHVSAICLHSAHYLLLHDFQLCIIAKWITY